MLVIVKIKDMKMEGEKFLAGCEQVGPSLDKGDRWLRLRSLVRSGGSAVASTRAEESQ